MSPAQLRRVVRALADGLRRALPVLLALADALAARRRKPNPPR
jgi:hypothetical protein